MFCAKWKSLHMLDNLILIGMPGAGKSTVGVVLAKKLGMRFVDSDLVIQEQAGRLLHRIIEEDGLEGFLELEDRVNRELLVHNSVVATGGSAVYGTKAMNHFKTLGRVVYLKLPLAEVAERLGDLKERGVAMRPEQTLADLYEERVRLYEQYADETVDCEGKTLREIVEELTEYVFAG